MSRSVPWRRNCPDKVTKRIERASRAQIYLLRATGPTGFLVTAEGDDRKFKVFLGDPHSCTCPVFQKERDLCIHILWVLIKKFRVSKENPVIYQLGLVEREIGEVFRGIFSSTASSQANGNSSKSEETVCREKLSKKQITEDDVCPICQEDLFGQTQPTTYCEYGCGNSIHIKCMKIWAEHQKSSGESIMKCPLCRVDFGPFEVIKKEYLRSTKTRQKKDVHVGAVCAQCGMSPISGKCYRCNVCTNYQLCKECFSSNSHSDHPFVSRQKPNERWRPASKFQAIPPAAANDLQSREITNDDYTLLLQLDGSSVNQTSVPGHVLNSFSVERITSNDRRLSNSDEKCAVCYQGYRPSQMIRRLPCKHEFHRSCIDSWLSNEHNTCPVDGQTVYSPFELGRNLHQVARNGSPSTSNNQRSSRESSFSIKKTRLSTMIKKQQRLQVEQGDSLSQNFSVNGLGIQQRNVQGAIQVSSRPHRTNSAPTIEQSLQRAESSSKHIAFDTNLPGRPVISAEQVMRYGRHSGDSRIRRCMGLKRPSGHKSIALRTQSLNDITLSGRGISSGNLLRDRPMNNADSRRSPQQDSANHEANVIRTSIVAPSSESRICRFLPVDI